METVGLLIKAGCNTALTNDRKQTGWELASDTRRSAALEKLRSLAKGVRIPVQSTAAALLHGSTVCRRWWVGLRLRW